MTRLISLLQQRVSANGFSEGDISESELACFVHAACLSPSAYHLQNWYFTAVQSKEAKHALYQAAFCQPKILQAAAVIVMSGDLLAYRHLADRLQPSVQAGILSAHTAESWSRAAYGALHENAPAQRDEAVRSVSLAAMPLMLAAQERGWATCPMSGFDPEAVRQVAGLAENLLPVLLVAIGKPESNQKQKIRMPVNHVFTVI
ncbi:nitroreductase family protein [Neisseria dumasiana]|uniref:nitroreductase family protein n=1 Tax=Neisseria dumasiana TaxID=1931275 RepID=UPI000A19AF84|nr:nitroreductase family protein [Neisseria dumasiana]OSI17166.1 hypothetical protein BV914_01570 [Neisseria dumasiana]